MNLIIDICLGFTIPMIYLFIGFTCANLLCKVIDMQEFGCILVFTWPIMVPFIIVVKLSGVFSDWIYRNIKGGK